MSRLSQLEQALHKSDLTRQVLFHNSGECVCLTDLEGRILEANPSLLEKMGMTPGELRQKHLGEILTKEDMSKLQEAMGEILAGRTVRQLEVTGCGAGGQKFQCEVAAVPLKENGKVIAMLCLGRDVTDARQCERDLRIKHSAIESAINAIVIADLQGHLTYVNPAFLKMWGYENEDDVLGRIGIEFWADKEAAKRGMQSIQRDGGWSGELVAERKDHSHFDVHLSASLVTGEDGKPLCMMASFIDITGRREMERALRESEQRFRTIIETVPVITYTAALDETSSTLYVSPQVEKLLGYSQQEYASDPDLWFKLLHPEDRDRVVEEVTRARSREEPFDIEYRMIRKDGHIIWFRDAGSLIRDEEGNPIVLQGAMFDITERKQAEEAMRQSEGRFRSLVETTSDWVWEVDSSGVYTYASPKSRELLGYEPAELTGKTPFDLMPPEEAEKVAGLYRDIIRSRKPFARLENTNLRKDGRPVVLETSGVPLFDADGEFAGYRGIDRDITERKQSEEALRESEAKHRTLLENLPQRAFSKDKDSVYVSCNRNFARGVGINPDDLPGKTDYDFFPKDLADKYRADDRKVLASGRVLEIEEEYVDRARGGEKRTVHTVKAPIKDANGKSVGVLGIFWDITDRKRAEEALHSVHLQLMLARDQERRRLAGELHDSIGQGLIALRLLMQSTLANHADLASESQSRDLANAAEKCNDMVKEIRHICYGLHPPILESLGLAASLRQIAKDCLPQLRADFQCSKALEERRFEPDMEIAFFRIAQEAIHNALDHSHAKNLTIRLKASKDRLTMIVDDDGVGFDLQNTEAKGLGLSTMAERANTVGGELTIVSTKKEAGTHIKVKVPLGPAPKDKPSI